MTRECPQPPPSIGSPPPARPERRPRPSPHAHRMRPPRTPRRSPRQARSGRRCRRRPPCAPGPRRCRRPSSHAPRRYVAGVRARPAAATTRAAAATSSLGTPPRMPRRHASSEPARASTSNAGSPSSQISSSVDQAIGTAAVAILEQPDRADHRGRQDRPVGGLVVEAHVPRDDRHIELAAGCRRCRRWRARAARRPGRSRVSRS